MDDLNMDGWHLHFLSDDKTNGGHVLELNMTKANAGIDIISEFNIFFQRKNPLQKWTCLKI